MVATLKYGATQKYINDLLEKLSNDAKDKGFDAHKFCGKLNIKEDGLSVQKKMRDEWE